MRLFRGGRQRRPETRGLTLFPARGPDGAGRAERIQRMAERLGYTVRHETRYAPRAGTQAQLCDDVVVYDVSDPLDQAGPYRALTPNYVYCDHVLLASTTPLPLNLLPVRGGGAPVYPYPLRKLPDGGPIRYPTYRLDGTPADDWVGDDDHSMIAWLEAQLSDLAQRPTGPRLSRSGSDEPDWPTRASTQEFVSALPHFFRPNGLTFVSHRGRYFDDVWKHVETFVDAGTRRTRRVRVVSPTELAIEGELLTAARRCMIVGLLRHIIFNAAEFVVYETPDYLESWWTAVELLYAHIARAKRDDGLIATAPEVMVMQGSPPALRHDLGDLAPMVSLDDLSEIESLVVMVAPGVSSTFGDAHDGALGAPPPGVVSWEWFWQGLLLDPPAPRTPLRASARALLDAQAAMSVVSAEAASRAVLADGVVVADDGTRSRIAALPPRLLFDKPLVRLPERPVVHQIPTYYAMR